MAKKPQDTLVALAQAGNNLAKAPLLIDNNWAKAMANDSPFIYRSSSTNYSPKLTELKRIHLEYQNQGKYASKK
ncbi:MAG: hypothetical protein WC438_01795 [Candidatus Pacearchaeota archaeon]